MKSEDGKSILDITFKSMFDVILERPSKQHINGNKATCRLVASSSPILTPYCRNPYPVILSVLFRITVFCLDVYMGVQCALRIDLHRMYILYQPFAGVRSTCKTGCEAEDPKFVTSLSTAVVVHAAATIQNDFKSTSNKLRSSEAQ